MPKGVTVVDFGVPREAQVGCQGPELLPCMRLKTVQPTRGGRAFGIDVFQMQVTRNQVVRRLCHRTIATASLCAYHACSRRAYPGGSGN